MAMNPQHIQEARGFHQKGDFARAIAMYEEALRDDPRLAEVWQLKGMAEHQSGRLHDARQSAARAIETAGETVPLLLFEGSVLHDLGELAEAEQRFARAAAAELDARTSTRDGPRRRWRISRLRSAPIPITCARGTTSASPCNRSTASTMPGAPSTTR